MVLSVGKGQLGWGKGGGKTHWRMKWSPGLEPEYLCEFSPLFKICSCGLAGHT